MQIGLITVFDAILKGGQSGQKLQCLLACVAADSFPFSGGAEIEQVNEKQATKGARLGWAKNLGRSREGVSKKGEGVPCGVFENMTSFTPILNEELEQGKLMAALKKETAATQAKCLYIWESDGK